MQGDKNASRMSMATLARGGESLKPFARRLSLVLMGVLLFGAGLVIGRGDISAQFSASQQINPDLPTNLDYSSVERVYDSLRQNYSGAVTNQELLDGLKHGLANATNDPYTSYFTPEEAKVFSNEIENTFGGIGAKLGNDAQGNLLVESPLTGSPAEKAGLRAKDIIVKINNNDTQGYSLAKAVSQIRGKAGTKVTLVVVRDHARQLTFTVTRENIKIPSVTHKILKNNIGYIQITSFSNDTADLTAKAIAQLKADHAKAIVLDLRNNPGGHLDQAVKVASHWLPEGKTILSEKRGDIVVDESQSTGTHDAVKIPTVILINAGSASASEIVAGALHDNAAAYLIGEKSFGKGVVQQIIDFKDGGQLKVTIASWYRPNGQNINKKGIAPDKAVTISDSDASKGSDPQLDAATAYLQAR
jgi:carboxyl-terminal processing protease